MNVEIAYFILMKTTMVFLLLSQLILANTYYVTEAGSDLQNGLSISEAFATIQKASDLVNAGDTVLVEAGNYAGFNHQGNSGVPADPIVFLATGEVFITSSCPDRDDGINIEGADWITIDGFIVNNMPGSGNGIRAALSDHILIRNNSCDNNAERGIFTGFTDDITIEYNLCTNSIDEHGIYVSNSSDRPIIRYNECFGNNNIGIHMNGDASLGEDGIIHDAEVYGNIIHDNNRAAGINMDGCLRPKVYNNLIYNNHTAQGIALFQEDGGIPTQQAQIYNNTIIVPTDGRWGILVNEGSQIGTKIFNNIIINNHSFRGSITTTSTSDGFMSDFNIVSNKMSTSGDGSSTTLAVWQQSGNDLNSMIADQEADIFIDPANFDFRLKLGSQAIDAGSAFVSTLIEDDIVGMSRPQNELFDIGVYERIYCPEKRTLNIDDVPLKGFYFANDTIFLDGNFSISADAFIQSKTIVNNSNIQLASLVRLMITNSGCPED